MIDPTHDQTIAAFDEARQMVDTFDSVPIQKTPITSRVISRWLRGLPEGGQFDHSFPKNFDQHEWTTCGHLPEPRLCYGLANRPGRLMCADCFLAEAQLSDTSCDWCGVSREQDARTTLYPAIYAIGPAIVLLMLCDNHLVQGDCGAYKAATHLLHT